MKTRIIYIIVILASLSAISACTRLGPHSLVNTIPPENETLSAMNETIVRIHIYMKDKHMPPPNLATLPIRKDRMNSTRDGWGRELQYSIDDNGVITLMSYGPGGEHGDPSKRIIQRYRTRNPDGTSCIDQKDWIVSAEIHEVK